MNKKLILYWFNISKISFMILFSGFIASGCATSLSPSAARIMDADDKIVQGCTYVGEVNGTSGWGNLAASVGIQNAKNEARENAVALGATHVLWTNISGGYSPYVSGRAYRCK